MVRKIIEKVEVDFPYEPYDCQMVYMTRVLQALELRCDAALESPTGTGKTLSLLCATLGWLQKQKELLKPTFQEVMTLVNDKSNSSSGSVRCPLLSRVYYCSRTHSQLAQVVRELNKTMYKIVPTAILASRDQTCVHEKVSKEDDTRLKNSMCRSLVAKRTCHYYNKWDQTDTDTMRQIYGESGQVLDIEDLVRIAKQHSHCPYYRSRQMHENADLVLLPYNYLIDPKLRQTHNIDLKGSIVIFDEAHNLESICEECVSVELTTTDLALCIRELKKAIEIVQEDTELIRTALDNASAAFSSGVEETPKKEKEPLNIGTAAIVLNMLFELEKSIEEGYADSSSATCSRDFPGKVYPGDYLVKLLAKAELTIDKIPESIEVLRKAADALHDKAEEHGSSHIFSDRGLYLQKFESFLAGVFSSHAENVTLPNADPTLNRYQQLKPEAVAKDFKLYMVKTATDDEGEKITLNYWCFTATLAMRYLKSRGVRSVIVTSGTLSPLQNFMSNIGLDFGCTLENGHAANSNQIVAGIVKKAPNLSNRDELLAGNFMNRGNLDYHLAIGGAMLQLAKTVPQGVLVFFSSYSLMFQAIDILKQKQPQLHGQSIWNLLEAQKTVVVEPKNKKMLGAVRAQFSSAVRGSSENGESKKDSKGAMFLAVCRGKVSEGIDFADADSRAVLIVGIPYPPLKDPRVSLKKIYLDEKRAANPKTAAQSGDSWYQTEGYRAVNQAIGRVLRHVNDFGVVALLDSRFASTKPSNFPSWMRPSMRTFETFQEFHTLTETFFRERGVEIRASRSKLLETPLTQGKIRKKRVNLTIEAEQPMVFDHREIFVQPSVQEVKKRSKAIQSLGELEDCAGEAEATNTTTDASFAPLAKSFGAVPVTAQTTADVATRPAKKKIRLSQNVRIGADPTNVPVKSSDISSSTSRSALSAKDPALKGDVHPVKVSTDNSDEPQLVNEVSKKMPDSYRDALNISNVDNMKLLKESGLKKEVAQILKDLKSGKAFQDVLKYMVQLLLPGNPRLFVVLAKYFPPTERDNILEEAIARNLQF